MFTVKVIKKHGVPYGTPEVLAYVDPDAPGEADITLYQHNISFSTAVITLITTDSTPFTAATLAGFLKNKGFSSDNVLKIMSGYGISKLPPYPGQLEFNQKTALYPSGDGLSLYSSSETRRMYIDENGLNITASSTSTSTISTIQDNVLTIGE